MSDFVTVGERKISYTIRKSKRAKRVGLVVHSDGRVVATIPQRAHEHSAISFVETKKMWLAKILAFYERFENTSLASLGRKDYLKHKERARTLVTSRVAHLNQRYGFVFNRIAIRNQKTRWGSCTSKKNLNFNYKIAFLTPEQQDYIIVHELCHLKEPNHSMQFWNLVAHSVPEHRRIRREMKRIL